MSLAMVVRWWGPYSFDDAREVGDFTGLYLVYGRNRRGRRPAEDKLLYVGISENQHGVGQRIYEHRNDRYAHPDNDWWVGQIVSPARSTRRHLEVAEWLLVYFSGSEHNERKAFHPPRETCHLINEWFKPNEEHYQRTRGAAAWVSDVLSWWPESSTIRWADRMCNETIDV